MNKINTKKGFTIIEVVLVLAIAGLIFLMVFIALPALQRNQRDTQRKNDLSRVQSAINSYQANNRGKIPAYNIMNSDFKSRYLITTAGNDSFEDPTGRGYEFSNNTGNISWVNSNEAVKIQYAVGSRCDGEDLVANQGNNKVALRLALEGGGVYCLNN